MTTNQTKITVAKSSIAISIAFAGCIGATFSQAQTATDSWAVGAGVAYPRFFSSNNDDEDWNYGAYLSGQRNFSEHVGTRLKGSYSHLESEWADEREKTDLLSLDLSLLYYLVPCEPLSPYLFTGIGTHYKFLSNKASPDIDENSLGAQLHLGIGSEFKINPVWSIVTEFGYSITNNSELDGTVIATEMNGRDSYITLNLGVNYRFGQGGESMQCKQCQQQLVVSTDMTDYQRIEELVVKHIPREVLKETNKETIKEIPVDRYIQEVSKDKLVLVGVNFDFDKSNLLSESYPVLNKVASLLKERPEVNVEIEGYTDYVGSLAYNLNLSIERAERVKEYLVTQGIEAKRLTTFGYGKRNPAEDNQTESGREMNRRIVFRIIK